MKAKKIISALLLVCLLASVMSVSAFADEPDTASEPASEPVIVTGEPAPDEAPAPAEAPALAPAGDPALAPAGAPAPASPSDITLVFSSRTVRVGGTITMTANGSNFSQWVVEPTSTGKGTIDIVTNRTATFTAAEAGTVWISALDTSGNKVTLDVNVTDIRTPIVVCDVTQLVLDEFGNTKAYFYVSNRENSDEQFTWKYVTSPSGVEVIKQAADYKTGLDLWAGKGSGTVTVTATDKYGVSGSLTIPVNSVEGVDTSISPKTVTWSRGQGNLTFTVSPNFYAAYIDGVCFTGSGNTDKYTHVWSSSNLVIKSSYLATLSAGQHTLRVETRYNNNTSSGSAYATITINGTANAIYGDNAHVRGNANNLIFTSSGGVKNVYISNQLIDPANYTLSADGKTLTLKANFLNLLNYGTYTMKLDTQSGGTETTSFRIVTANYAPATGDESNLAIWVAVLLISGVGAIALIPRRKKEM